MTHTFKVALLDYEDLSEEEQNNAKNNGHGKENASYIKVSHNGETIILKSDAMEPEDAVFYRDLSWVVLALRTCYNLGKQTHDK